MNKHGLLLVDKPKGLVSNQALKVIKKNMNVKKAGIVGVLDPLASGMLPIVVGEATKLSKYIENSFKQYNVTMKLGVKSDTGDNEGTLVYDKTPVPQYNNALIKDKISKFVGEYSQIPPMYSSIKVSGRKLYDLARKGIEIKRKSRKVKIINIKLLNYKDDIIELNVKCSKGTYIRTLVEDIGKCLGVSAMTDDLRRERVGGYEESQMVALSSLIDEKTCIEKLIKPLAIVRHLPSITVNNEEEISLRHGMEICQNMNFVDGEVIIQNKINQVVGIGYIKKGLISPKRLLKID